MHLPNISIRMAESTLQVYSKAKLLKSGIPGPVRLWALIRAHYFRRQNDELWLNFCEDVMTVSWLECCRQSLAAGTRLA